MTPRSRSRWRRAALGHVAADLAIHVGEDAVADAIVLQVKRLLRGFRRPPSGEPRTATIYGPRGEVLATVELEDDAEDAQPD